MSHQKNRLGRILGAYPSQHALCIIQKNTKAWNIDTRLLAMTGEIKADRCDCLFAEIRTHGRVVSRVGHAAMNGDDHATGICCFPQTHVVFTVSERQL